MMLCRAHWLYLHDAIAARGLWRHIANSAREAYAIIGRGGFEPLIAASAAISANAVAYCGPMAALKYGCPVCLALQSHLLTCCDPSCLFDEDFIIGQAADNQVGIAGQRHLLARC